MTADNDGAPVRKKTARSAMSDTAFVFGAMAAGAGLLVPLLGLAMNPVVFVATAIIMLAIGSLMRSMAVMRWDRTEPAWRPVLQHVEETLAKNTAHLDEVMLTQAASIDEASGEMEKAQAKLSKRFAGMEQWVAEHAVPFVQNPEKALDPIIKDLMKDSTRKAQVIQEDVQALRRQCESAIRAFAAMPSSDTMNEWPGMFQQIQSGMAALEELVKANDPSQFHDQIQDLRRSLRTMQDSHDASKDRWRTMEHQHEALSQRVAGLHIPSQASIDQRLDGMQHSIEARMPQLEGQIQTMREEILGECDQRFTIKDADQVHAIVASMQEQFMTELETRWTQHNQEVAVTVSGVQAELRGECETRWTRHAQHMEESVAGFRAQLREECEARFHSWQEGPGDMAINELRQELLAAIDGFEAPAIDAEAIFDQMRNEMRQTASGLEAKILEAHEHPEWDTALQSMRQAFAKVPAVVEEAVAPIRDEVRSHNPASIVQQAMVRLKEELRAWYTHADPSHVFDQGGSMVTEPKTPETPGQAFVNGPSDQSPPMRARNPNPGKPGQDRHHQALQAAQKRHDERVRGRAAPQETKAEMRRRVAAARNLVARTRRR